MKDGFSSLHESSSDHGIFCNSQLTVLDLFTGCGGFALGFNRAGFRVHGIDINKYVTEIFKLNRTGTAEIVDLMNGKISGRYDVITGGPPCKPWSAVNLQRRGAEHPDFPLLHVYVEHVERIRPAVFVMENVPPARGDAEREGESLHDLYDITVRILNYSEWGAPVRRRRMFMVGVRRDLNICAGEIFKSLENMKQKPKTVRDAIGKLNSKSDPEHIFPKFRTIRKYMDYYRKGKYGWYILRWDEPALSFGNIMKTYILHPDSVNGTPPRVISVREALCIMGFPEDFRFPPGMPVGIKYQMIADSVSPVFSEKLARAIRQVLEYHGYRNGE